MTAAVDLPASPATAEHVLGTLLDAVQDLSLARSLPDVQATVRTAARHLLRADGATFVLREGDKCSYVDEDAISPLWKGQRFPLEACISGWAMLHREPVAIEDIYEDERIPHDAYRPTFVRSLLMVPIRSREPVGAIGMYWAHHHAVSDSEVAAAQALADSTAVALEHVLVRQQLRESERLSETDVLTELPNRRAWDQLLRDALADGAAPACVALLDLDRFKDFNDRHGHQAGDDLLRRCGPAWRAVLREGDVVARYGGEEFAVLLPRCELTEALEVADRLRRAVPGGQTASVGVATWDGVESADELVGRADVALYVAKDSGRDRVAAAA